MTFAPREFMERELPPLAAAELPRDHRLEHPGGLDAEEDGRPRRRLRHRGPDGRRPQRAAARQAPSSTSAGEAIYGERDQVDLAKIRELGLPFWLAGGYGTARKAARGARRRRGRASKSARRSRSAPNRGCGKTTSARCSRKSPPGRRRSPPIRSPRPTGFPFKVAQLGRDALRARRLQGPGAHLRSGLPARSVPDAKTERSATAARPSRNRSTYRRAAKLEETDGRKCICNALLATVGYPQVRKGHRVEPGIVTSGNDLTDIGRFMPPRTGSNTPPRTW